MQFFLDYDECIHKMNQRGFSPILIIVIIAVTVGGILIYQNRNKPSSSSQIQTEIQRETSTTSSPTLTNEKIAWKSYVNKSSGLEFSYPSNLKIGESKGKYYTQEAETINLRNYDPQEEFRHKDAISISIAIIPVKEPIENLQKWLEDISIGNRIDGKVGPRVRKFSVYRNSVISGVEYLDGQESVWRNIAFEKNDEVFVFTLNPTTETGGSYDENKSAVEVFDRILTSIKFI